MSERIIKIEPYKSYDDIIRLSGRVILATPQCEIDIPASGILNLYKYEQNDNLIVPRDYENLWLRINLSWRKDFQIDVLDALAIEHENPSEVFALRTQVICEKTRWCSEQKKTTLDSISKSPILDFQIPINEIKDFIKVVGYITREVDGKETGLEAPTASLAIVSICKELNIQVDEVKDIGGEYLPIGAGNIGDLAFDIQGIDDSFDLPRILYSEDLKEFLTRDDLEAVNASILTGSLAFLDGYLKWVIFKCHLDLNDKHHKSIVDMFSSYCNISKEELINISGQEKFSQGQSKAYFALSIKLFKGMQLQNKYKRELKTLFKVNAK